MRWQMFVFLMCACANSNSDPLDTFGGLGESQGDASGRGSGNAVGSGNASGDVRAGTVGAAATAGDDAAGNDATSSEGLPHGTSETGEATHAGEGSSEGDDSGNIEGITSTLTISCAGQLQGRAVVHWNTNLGIAFTDAAIPYTFRGSISFDFPSEFTGAIDNPENYDPDFPRHTLAVVDQGYTTYGNHCYPFGTAPQAGTGTIYAFHPSEGIVRATFNNMPLANCVGGGVCLLSGTIETTGQGVFE